MKALRLVFSLSLLGVFSLNEESSIWARGEDEGKEVRMAVDASEAPLDLSEEEKKKLAETQESHAYQAEVTRLMDIIINSLYTQREVFLRELISNAVDALEKVRFMSVSDDSILSKGGKRNLDIRIDYDKDTNTLSITDTGIGMTKQDLINNLGTVAKSGTTNFLEAVAQGNDVNLIGQFGVGFYSAFLVADRVTVTTKHPDDDQFVWESSADAKFFVAKDPRGNTLGRGTRVTLHLKEDATEFLNEYKLKDLAAKFSQFMNFPIYVKVSKTIKEEIPEEDLEKPDDDDVEVKDEEEKKKKTKTVEKVVAEWEQVNTQKAIWLRNPKDVTDQEYKDFYKSISKDFMEPLSHIHFSAEGEIEFKSILFIPKKAPTDVFSNYFDKQTSIKLYVRRVLIADSFEDIFPKYLHFMKGVVDSDDLPLNVSREQLQQSKILNVISKKLVRKTLESIRKLAIDSAKMKEEQEKEYDAEEDEEKKKALKKKLDESSDYQTFYGEFSRNLKLGCYEDDANRSKISKLLMFVSSKSPKKLITLEEYVKRMQPNQNAIYYASGDSISQMMKLPQSQIFMQKDIEIIFLREAMDEPCIQKIIEFDGKKFESIQKGDISLDESDEAKRRGKGLSKVYEPLLQWWKGLLKSKVMKVDISKRLVNDPVAVIASQWGYSAQMEKIMKTQTFADPDQVRMLSGQKVLEINPNHRVIQILLERVKQDKDDAKAKEIADNLFNTAMLASGFDVDEPTDLANIVYRGIQRDLSIDDDKIISEMPVDMEPNAAEEKINPDDEEADDEVFPTEEKEADEKVDSADKHEEL